MLMGTTGRAQGGSSVEQVGCQKVLPLVSSDRKNAVFFCEELNNGH